MGLKELSKYEISFKEIILKAKKYSFTFSVIYNLYSMNLNNINALFYK